MSSWVRYLRPENLVTWPAFVITLVWALVIHFADGSNASLGRVGERLVIVLVIQLVMFAVLWLAARAVRDWPARSMAVGLLVAIVIATGLRGALLAIGLVWAGAVTDLQIVLRAAASIANIGSALVLVTVSTGEFREHVATRTRLVTDATRLRWLRDQADETVRLVNEELVSTIKGQLLAMIQPVAGTRTAPALESLRSTIDEVVRPLSHRLAERAGSWSPPAGNGAVRLDWRKALLEAGDPANIRPVLTALVISAMSAPTLVSTFGVGLAAAALCFINVAGWVNLGLARKLGSGVVAGRRAAVRSAVFVALMLLVGAVNTVGVGIILSGAENGDTYLRLGPFAVLLVGSLIAVYVSAQGQATAREEELRAVDAQLRWELARARELERQRTGAIARALHGRLQAALSAAYLRINLESAAGELREGELDAIRTELEHAIERLGADPELPEPVTDVVRRVQGTWTGIATITFAARDADLHQLTSDAACLQAIDDLIPELCFNAIKHAHASKIDITVRREEPRAILLTVRNDCPTGDLELGQEAGERSKGLGVQMIEGSALWWSRESRSGWTTTTVCLPFVAHSDQPSGDRVDRVRQ